MPPNIAAAKGFSAGGAPPAAPPMPPMPPIIAATDWRAAWHRARQLPAAGLQEQLQPAGHRLMEAGLWTMWQVCPSWTAYDSMVSGSSNLARIETLRRVARGGTGPGGITQHTQWRGRHVSAHSTCWLAGTHWWR